MRRNAHSSWWLARQNRRKPAPREGRSLHALPGMMVVATTQLVVTAMCVAGVSVGIRSRNVGNLDPNGGMVTDRKDKTPARNAGKAVRQEGTTGVYAIYS